MAGRRTCEVRVLGTNLHPPGVRGIFCKFVGSDVVSASYDGEEAVRCITPAVATPGWLAVHLINNDAIYATSVAFEYALVDRPIIFFDVPEILYAARKSKIDLDTWGRKAGDVVAAWLEHVGEA